MEDLMLNPDSYQTVMEYPVRNAKSVVIPDMVEWVVYLFAAILVVPGLVGNALLFCMSFRADMRKFSYSVYLFFASIADSLSLVYLYLNLLYQTQQISIFFTFPNLISCLIMSITVQTAARMSPWIMVVFSVDRLIAMVLPLKRKQLCTVRNAYIACGLVCFVSLAQEIPLALNITYYVIGDQRLCSTKFDFLSQWSIVESFVNTLLPCLLLLILNSYTLVIIKKGLRTRRTMMDGGTNCMAQATVDEPKRQRQQAGPYKRTDVTSMQSETLHSQTEANSGQTAHSYEHGESSHTQEGDNQRAEASPGYAEEESHEQGEMSRQQEGQSQQTGANQEPNRQSQQTGASHEPNRQSQQTRASHEPNRQSQQTGASCEQNRQKQQREANREEREVTKMTKALLTLPVFAFITLTPHTLVTSVLFIISRTSFTLQDFVMASEVYVRMIYSMSFASNFYLLIATSKSYRRIVRNMLSCSRP